MSQTPQTTAGRIEITWPRGRLTATLADTPTARRLLAALPLEAGANTWGEEVYFGAPIDAPLERDARQVVDPGTVCFWVQGNSLALPFGPTPLSRGRECRLVTAANVVGWIDGGDGDAEGGCRALQSVCDGDRIAVRALPQ